MYVGSMHIVYLQDLPAHVRPSEHLTLVRTFPRGSCAYDGMTDISEVCEECLGLRQQSQAPTRKQSSRAQCNPAVALRVAIVVSDS